MKLIKLVITAVFLATSISFAEQVTLEVTGRGEIEAIDTTKARNWAIIDGVRKAVEKGVNNFISTRLAAEDSVLLEENIYSKITGYIKSFDVVKEGVSQQLPNTYEVTIKVTLITDYLQRDLAALGIFMAKKGLPRVLVLVQEKNIDNVHWHFQTNDLNNAETRIREVLGIKGFMFVGYSTLLSELSTEEERAFYADDIGTILKVANRYDAGVIITGEAISRRAEGVTNLDGTLSLQAMVNLKAIRANKGDVISSSSATATAVHEDELAGGGLAIASAADKAVAELADRLINIWSQEIALKIEVTLIVNGLKSIEDLILFKNELQDRVKGIISLKRRTFSGNTAAYDLVSSIDGKAIASELVVKGLNSFKVRVRSKSKNSLELNLKLK